MSSTVRISVVANARAAQLAFANLSKSASNLAGNLRAASLVANAFTFAKLGATTGAIQTFGALVAVTFQAIGALGALPGIALAAGAAFGTLKLATAGLGKAIKVGMAGDARLYKRELDKLPPAMAAFVRQVVALKPAFDALRVSVSQALLGRISAQIKPLIQTYLPAVRALMIGIATDMGLAGDRSLQLLRKASSVGLLKKVFADIREGVHGVTHGLPGLTRGLLPIVQVSSTFLPKIFDATKVEKFANKFADAMEGSAASGTMETWIANGLNALKQIGSVLYQLGGIFKSVFIDANKNGLGFFATIAQLLKVVADFLNTAEGMAAVQAIWDAFSIISSEFGQALKVVMVEFGKALRALAPAVAPIANALSMFIIALAPLLPTIATLVAAIGIAFIPIFDAMGPVVTMLATTVISLITALLPLLPVIAQVAAIIGTALNTALLALVPLLMPVVDILGVVLLDVVRQLAPLLPIIGEALGHVLVALAPVVSALVGGLAGALAVLIPPLVRFVVVLAEALAPALIAFAPLIEIIATAFADILTAVAPLLKPLGEIFTKILEAAIPIVAAIYGGLVELVQALAEALLPAIIKLMPSFDVLATHFAEMAPLLPDLISAFVGLVIAILPLLPVLTELVSIIVVTAIPVLTTILPAAIWVVVTALKALTLIIESLVYLVTDWLLPGILHIVDFIRGWWRVMFDVGEYLIDGLVKGLTSAFHWVVDVYEKLGELPLWLKVILGIRSPSKVMAGLGENIMAGLVAGMRSQIPEIKKTVGEAAGTITALSATPTIDLGVPPVGVAAGGAGGVAGNVGAAYYITVNVAAGTDPAEAGRQIVRTIEAYERRSGHRRLVPAI